MVLADPYRSPKVRGFDARFEFEVRRLRGWDIQVMGGSRFVIRGHHPIRNFLLLAGGALLALVLSALAYWEGGRSSSSELKALRDAVSNQRQTIEGLRIANRDLGVHLSVAQRTAQVDKAAAAAMRIGLDSREEELHELNRAVRFYQSVLAADNKDNRLDIHRLRVQAAGSVQGAFEVEIILTRFLDAESLVEGTALVSVRGHVSGRYSVETLALPFRVKHFQRIRGIVQLTENFEPTQILVQATAEDKRRIIRAERTIPWENAVSE